MLIDIEITGDEGYGMLLNRFTEEAAEKATRGSTAARRGEPETEYEQSYNALYIGTNGFAGKCIIPGFNLARCLMEGGRWHKQGKKQVTTQKSSLVPAAMRILEDEIPIESDQTWDIDTRPIRNPTTGGRILRSRPRFRTWKLQFTIRLNEERISESLIRKIIDDAGQCIGLGDFRPDCKGPFGTFKVTRWKKLPGTQTTNKARKVKAIDAERKH